MIPDSGFQNSNLFQLKNELLNELYKNFDSQPKVKNSIGYHFHGINILFSSPDEKFLHQITSFLPKEWVSESSEYDLEVSFLNQWGKDWDLEENPNCVIEQRENLEVALQRDFIGIDDGTRVLTCLESTHGDGIFNILRWLLPRRMIKKGSFLLHSSCVIDDGKAYFFLGHSGAGKSTMAKLGGERIVLGDDMNVLHLKNETLYARAGGLGGLNFVNTDYVKDYPVAGFYWLKQSNLNKRSQMDPSKGATKLLASFANVFWESLHENDRSVLMNLSIKVSELAPFFSFEFKKEEECWNHVR